MVRLYMGAVGLTQQSQTVCICGTFTAAQMARTTNPSGPSANRAPALQGPSLTVVDHLFQSLVRLQQDTIISKQQREPILLAL